MEQNNYNTAELNKLLQAASQKMNMSPEELKKRLQNGTITDKESSGMLAQALSDPEAMKKMLATPQAQALLKKLMNGNGQHG